MCISFRHTRFGGGYPSGVYWMCCLAKLKGAAGCSVGRHEERVALEEG